MNFISVARNNSVATLALNRPTTNPIDNDLLNELSTYLSELEADPDVSAVILTSAQPKIFSFGFNLPSLVPLGKDDFAAFFENFNQTFLKLYRFPKPVIAALNGYTIAGGCILALCCDYRLMSNGKTLMGLNEVKLGALVPWAATLILGELIGRYKTEQAVLSGNLYGPVELLSLGMVNALCEPAELMERATAKAIEMGSVFNTAYAHMKSTLRERVYTAIMERYAEENARMVDLWYEPKTRELITAAAEKF